MIFNSLHAWIIPSFRQIKSEESISHLIYADTVDKISISKGIDSLDAVMSAYYLLHSIYLYNNRTGEFISTINGYEADGCSDFTLSGIIHNIKQYGVYKYIPRKIIYSINSNIFNTGQDEIQTENVFSIIVGDIPESGNTINGALVVNISEKKIREYFLAADTNTSGDLIVIDDSGKILTHPDESQFGANFSNFSYIRKITESVNDEGVFTDTIRDTRYLVSYITHPTWKWHFINIMPYDTIFSDLNHYLNSTIVVFIILMCLSVLLAFFASLRIYSPIKRLFNYSLKLKDKYISADNPDDKKQLGELQALDKIFKQIVERAEDAVNHLEDYKEFNKKEIIKELLVGGLDSIEQENHKDFIKCEFDSGPYLLAIISLDNFKTLIKTLNAEEITKLFTIIKELCSHYLAFSHFFLQIRNDHACIICCVKGLINGQEDKAEKIGDMFTSIKDSIKLQLNHTITVGISDIFQGTDQFSARYNMALEATRYRFRYGHDSLIYAPDVVVGKNNYFLQPEEQIDLLFNELKMGRLAKAEEILNSVLTEAKAYNYEDFIYLVHFLFYKSRKEIESAKENLSQSYNNLNELIDEIDALETLDEINAKFLEIFSLMIDTMQKKHSSKALSLAEEVKEYIDSNFKDASLYSESIAEQMGFSTHYIRLTFRNIFNISIIEYINKLRLDFCKQQLEESRQPVKKIFKLAGYYNYSYFFTLFKKKTGLTPNQFRFQQRKK